MDDIKIFTNRSGYQEYLGGEAVATHQYSGHTSFLQHHLCKMSTLMIFEAELVGVLLMVHILCNETQHATLHPKSSLIALDNQAVITMHK